MAKQKQGELRLLKSGVVFGPTDRDGLDRLLASGRIGPDDHVSVHNGPWTRVADYLSAPAAAAFQTAPPAPKPSVEPTKKKGDLRVLTGGRIVGLLTRDDVEGLWKASRVGDEDLICAVGGPWMRVGDFFAPPAAQTPVTPAASASPSPPAPASAPIPVGQASQPLLMPIPLKPKQAGAPQNAPQPPAAPAPQLPAASGQSPNSRLSDEWFVRVRGIHSSPLKLQHVKALYQAKEVTLDNVARHPRWSENDWRPLHAIPELAGITRP
jgi:hypothetical protein